MRILFRRTGPRGYAIEARRIDYPDVGMNPAPGYDPLLPHDVLHMVVESELGLRLGVFGQLAAGGDAGSFGRDLESAGSDRERSRRQRRTAARGKRLLREGRRDLHFSEQATYACWQEWLARSGDKAHRQLAASMAEQAGRCRELLSELERLDLDRAMDSICGHLDEISARWVDLEVGGAVVVTWPELAVETESSRGAGIRSERRNARPA